MTDNYDYEQELTPFISSPPSGVAAIQRNRRGPMARLSVSRNIASSVVNTNSSRQKNSSTSTSRSNKRNYDVETSSTRSQDNSIDNLEQLMDTVLYRSDSNSDKSKTSHDIRSRTKFRSAFSAFNRYGPPKEDSDFFESFQTVPHQRSPSIIFDISCLSSSKKKISVNRLIFVSISFSIFFIVILFNPSIIHGDNIHVDAIRKKRASNNDNYKYNITSLNDEMSIHMKLRSSIIGHEKTMDVGFTTDDMVYDHVVRSKLLHGQTIGNFQKDDNHIIPTDDIVPNESEKTSLDELTNNNSGSGASSLKSKSKEPVRDDYTSLSNVTNVVIEIPEVEDVIIGVNQTDTSLSN